MTPSCYDCRWGKLTPGILPSKKGAEEQEQIISCSNQNVQSSFFDNPKLEESSDPFKWAAQNCGGFESDKMNVASKISRLKKNN